jgi:4-aminobutyrate aminotransferase
MPIEKSIQLKTHLPGPNARAILEKDQQYISPSYSRPYPLVASKGQGMVIVDVDGNHFLDFTAGIAVCSTGHCHPRIVKAIEQQASQLIHMSGTDFYYARMVELAEKLATITPGNYPKQVAYGNSGTEAIEAAMKLARYATKRSKFIAFYNCFHGRTYGALSLTCSKPVQRKGFGPFLEGVTHVPFPNAYRCPVQHAGGDCDCSLRYIEEVLFKTALDPSEVAAIVFEPIQGEGGYVVAPQSFFDGLKRISAQYGILLIADEVQSGMGRTGRMFAVDHFGLIPDIIALAKGLASGMPLGAIVAPTRLMTWEPGAHASTFGGNPVSCAAALETIRLLEEGLIANAAAIGNFLLDELHSMARRHEMIGQVRGLGLMIGIELVKDRAAKEKAGAWRNAVVRKAFEKGLLILGCGDNTIRLMPPLVVNQAQAEEALAILDEAFIAVAKQR